MKKLKNIFLFGFLVCFSIFLGIQASILAFGFNYGNLFYKLSSAVDDKVAIEEDFFKSNSFKNVFDNLCLELMYSITNVEKYSEDVYEDPGYYDEATEEYTITEKEFVQNRKRESINYLRRISNIQYFAVNNETNEKFTNTNYKSLEDFKNHADGYYQLQIEDNDIVKRKIDGQDYNAKEFVNGLYISEITYLDEDNSVYVSVSKDIIDNGLEFYHESQVYNNALILYNLWIKVSIPAIVIAMIFLLIYVIINFKLPKTKREFWKIYNKIPLEVIALFLAIDIFAIVAILVEITNPILALACALLPIFLILFYFILLIKQISNFEKKSDFLKTILTYRFLALIFRKITGSILEIKNAIKYSSRFDIIEKLVMASVCCGFLQIVVGIRDINIFLLITLLTIQLAFLLFLINKIIYLNQIMDAVHKIKEGDINYKVEEKDDIYFGVLANDINNIREGLESSIEKRVKSERMKSELITNVSHDLKTPLTSIINYIELIKKEENIEPDYIKDYIGVLDKKSKRLKILIDDLFEASKASTGNIELELVRFDIKQLLRQSIGEFEEKLEENNLSLRVKLTDEEAFVLADGKRLYRVFENLLSNICKYALPNTRVYIDLEKHEDKIKVIMKNVSSYELNFDTEEIIERFKRADESRNTEGSGLGLAIARDLISLQGGKLTIEIDGDLFKAIVELDECKPIDLAK